MKPLTYLELLHRLDQLDKDQLNCSVCVALGDYEYTDIYDTILSDELDEETVDIVGDNQPLLLTWSKE